MPKFRSMRIDTSVAATHLLKKPDEYLAPIGPFLRKFSSDELPRLVQGITGWAQINGRNELPIPVKVQHDEY